MWHNSVLLKTTSITGFTVLQFYLIRDYGPVELGTCLLDQDLYVVFFILVLIANLVHSKVFEDGLSVAHFFLMLQ